MQDNETLAALFVRNRKSIRNCSNGNPLSSLLAHYVRRDRLRILMYHSVADAPVNRLTVGPEMFAAQMRYLADHRFEVISLQDACYLLETHGNVQRKIVLTFDDGYVDFLTTAAPILQKQALRQRSLSSPDASAKTRSGVRRTRRANTVRGRTEQGQSDGLCAGQPYGDARGFDNP